MVEFECSQRRCAIRGRSGHFKAGVGGNDRAQQAAHDGGVVDDQDSGSAHVRHGSDLRQTEHGQLFS